MKIRWIDNENQTIVLSSKTCKILQLGKEATLHFGQLKGNFTVRVDGVMDHDVIGIPRTFAAKYTIPTDLPYDVYTEGANLFIGPFIAVVVSKRGKLTEARKQRWEEYCKNYPSIRGLIYFCYPQRINVSTNMVRGFSYHPDGSERWVAGRYPLPGAIYRLTSLKLEVFQALKASLKGAIFNGFSLNKWRTYQILAEAGFIYMPYTEQLNGISGVMGMVNRFGSVYLKPINGIFGRGINRIERTSDGYRLEDDRGKSTTGESLSQLFDLFHLGKKKGRYIIQQGVSSRSTSENLIDFRVILQKDGSQEWTGTGTIARTGLKGRIVTNVVADMCNGLDALQQVFGLSQGEAIRKEKEIYDVCIKACRTLERSHGLYGDVGIDVALDREYKPWILELNFFHQHGIASYVEGEQAMYERVIAKPLEYARALAGFTDSNA